MNEEEMAAGLAATPSYRYADVVRNELFVAGQVPLDSQGDLVGVDDPAIQATTCLENLKLVIAANSFAITDVRHLTVSVVGEHQNLLTAWHAVTAWWNNDVPPATLVGVNNLGYRTQLVEIDARIVRDRDA